MYRSTVDLVGKVGFCPNFWHTNSISYLSDLSKPLRQYLLSQINTILPVSYEPSSRSKLNFKSNFPHMMSVLNWQSRSIMSRGALVNTFTGILKKIWHWTSQLTPEYLQLRHVQLQISGKLIALNSIDLKTFFSKL